MVEDEVRPSHSTFRYLETLWWNKWQRGVGCSSFGESSTEQICRGELGRQTQCSSGFNAVSLCARRGFALQRMPNEVAAQVELQRTRDAINH